MAENDGTPLTRGEICRYGRQLILPEWGVKGQTKMKSASVLIVGAGGLGCPAAQYLAAAGIGRLGLVDYDEVELSNLHRQILHKEKNVGVAKVSSAQEALESLNSQIIVSCHHLLLNSGNAFDVIKNYDVILDATDNVATRYLLNDACVLLRKPLVSGSALRFEGQLTVYNYCNGPCYRCLFPSPPSPQSVTNCSEGGVLGVVPGIIGSMQALEAMKIITGVGESLFGKLLLFDGLSGMFRRITLRSRDPACAVCGDDPSVRDLIDYEMFCGASPDDKGTQVTLLESEDRISCQRYKNIVDEKMSHVLLDVREPVEYEICHLPNSHNIPLSTIQKAADISSLLAHLIPKEKVPLFVVCRRGNDSQIAVQLLRRALVDSSVLSVHDISGGLVDWSSNIDRNFPQY